MSGRHGVTDQDVPTLVALAKRLRQETYGCGEWQEPGIVATVRDMVGWNYATAVEQILRRAADPEARTPKAMLHRMTSAALPSEKPKYAGPLKAVDECPLHIGQPRPPHCATCATDAVDAYSDHEPPDLPPLTEVNPRLAQRIKALTLYAEEDADVVPE